MVAEVAAEHRRSAKTVDCSPCTDERNAMRLTFLLATISVSLSAVSLHVAAEELRGAARHAYEKATSEGSLSTSCSAASPDFVFWAGDTPSTIEVDGKPQPVQFEHHRVGDYIRKPYQCQTSAGRLTMTTKLTHTISNAQCGAGNDFVARFAVPHLGSYSDDFLVDGCGGTSGLLIRGERVLFCRMNDGDKAGVGRCAEAADAAGPRRLR
jgi:hypothetical protein